MRFLKIVLVIVALLLCLANSVAAQVDCSVVNTAYECHLDGSMADTQYGVIIIPADLSGIVPDGATGYIGWGGAGSQVVTFDNSGVTGVINAEDIPYNVAFNQPPLQADCVNYINTGWLYVPGDNVIDHCGNPPQNCQYVSATIPYDLAWSTVVDLVNRYYFDLVCNVNGVPTVILTVVSENNSLPSTAPKAVKLVPPFNQACLAAGLSYQNPLVLSVKEQCWNQLVGNATHVVMRVEHRDAQQPYVEFIFFLSVEPYTKNDVIYCDMNPITLAVVPIEQCHR